MSGPSYGPVRILVTSLYSAVRPVKCGRKWMLNAALLEAQNTFGQVVVRDSDTHSSKPTKDYEQFVSALLGMNDKAEEATRTQCRIMPAGNVLPTRCV